MSFRVWLSAPMANGSLPLALDQTAKVWDAERGKELLTLRGHSSIVQGVAFNPDGKRLASQR